MNLPIAIEICVAPAPFPTMDVTVLELEDRILHLSSTELHKYAPQFSVCWHFEAHHSSLSLDINVRKKMSNTWLELQVQ